PRSAVARRRDASSWFELAGEIGARDAALESGNGSRWIERLWAVFLQRLVRVPVLTSAGAGNGPQPGGVSRIALVIYERPRAIERGRPDVGGIPAYRIARGIADVAIDAFDCGIRDDGGGDRDRTGEDPDDAGGPLGPPWP